MALGASQIKCFISPAPLLVKLCLVRAVLKPYYSAVRYLCLSCCLCLIFPMVFGETQYVAAQSSSAQEQDVQQTPNKTNIFEEKYLEALAKGAKAKHSDTEDTQSKVIASDQGEQQAAYEHILFEYFQQHYDSSLMLIAVGDESHRFSALSSDDKDRLRLMQGASQLKVGLYRQAQEGLLALLAKTTSEYVQANTWYWLAKAGFENRQYTLSEKAFKVIGENGLVEYITPDQWQELIYLTVFTRMQQGQNWQEDFKGLDASTIYPAYVHANYASMQFNEGEYAQAEASFVASKQALISYQNVQNSWLKQAGTALDSLLEFNWINPMTWFSSDPNAQAQGKLEAEQKSYEQKEINALYDRINLGLAYALLQQQDDKNALSVISTVSSDGGESEQALLTLGWAMAEQNRWQSALQVWQYLRGQSAGLYGLQASYGIAYAYQQQGDFTNAFFALDDTTKQIQTTILALENFSSQIQQDAFFDAVDTGNIIERDTTATRDSFESFASDDQQAEKGIRRVNSISELGQALGLEPAQEQSYIEPSAIQNTQADWPSNLLDIKRMFLSTRADFDASFLLSVRREAKQSLMLLNDRAKQLRTLEQMLNIRKQRYAQRQQNLSLERAEASLKEASQQIAKIEAILSDAQALPESSLKMASKEQASHLRRLANAQARLKRLQNDKSDGQSLNPEYEKRVARLKGLMQWQLSDNFIANRWAHQSLLAKARSALEQAQQSYERLSARQQDTQLFAKQQAQIDALAINVLNQQSQARAIYENANEQLQRNLLSIIEQRIAQLNTQEENTRLAKIRLQDLTPEAL